MEFNGFMDKVLSAFGLAGDSVRSLADTATDKAKAGARIAKLSMDAATAREEVKKTYLEIGRLYYETHKDEPEGFFVQLFDEVRLIEESIAAKEAEIASLKADLTAPVQPDVSVEFEGVVEQTEAAADAAEEAVESAVETAEEAAETAVETVEKAAEEAASEN